MERETSFVHSFERERAHLLQVVAQPGELSLMPRALLVLALAKQRAHIRHYLPDLRHLDINKQSKIHLLENAYVHIFKTEHDALCTCVCTWIRA